MRKQDLYTGAVVYHSMFPHWGKGKVLCQERVSELGSRGYRYVLRYKVEWEHTFPNGKNHSHCHAFELRKTFNQKKADLIAKIKLGKEK